MNIKTRFNKAVQDLVGINHYLAAEVTKLGYPTLEEGIPTAGVGWDENKKKIVFLFNPEFAKSLTDEEMCFTVGHECLHLLYSHVFLLRDEIEKLKRIQKSNEEIYRFKRKMNIAMDCVVNDSLTNLYDIPKVFAEDPEISKKVKAFYGKETVGIECQDLTAMDVYYLLPEDKNQESAGDVANHKLWESFFDKNGSISKKFIDTMKNFIEKGMQNSALSDGEASIIDDMKKDLQNSSDAYAAKAGNEAVGQKRPIDGLSRETINWNKILYQFVDTMRPEDIWTKPNRKLITIYPEVILPSWKDQEKEKIFVAVDASASIDKKALSLFVNVLKNTPKRFEIQAISFDTRCYEYDIMGNDPPKGGGGTSFSIIQKYIDDNLKKEPKAIFVMSDGEGSIVSPKHPERWCWLLYNSCYTGYIGNMKWYKIVDLLKKQ